MATRTSLTALTKDELVTLLKQAGSRTVTAESLTGAPTNPDGTYNLIHFVAWMLKERNGD